MISTFGKPTKRQLLENALAQSQQVQEFAQNPQNFGGGYAGGFGAIAQGLTAGIGAYTAYKQRQQIAQIEAEDNQKFSDFAMEKGDTDLAGIAEQLTPETKQAYYMQKLLPDMMRGYGYQAPASQREYEYYKNLSPEQQAQYLGLKRNIAGEGGIVRETGSIDTLRGYGQAGARKTGMEQTAKNVSDLNYKPEIAKETTKQEAIGKKEGSEAVNVINASQTNEIIQEAKKILPQATSGVFQRGVSGSASLAGISTTMDKADRQLQILGGKLTSSVPRFEGSQSNYDVELYKKMAGDIANPNVAYKSRLVALREIEKLNNKYMKKSPAKSQAPAGQNQTQNIKFLGFE